MDDNDAREHDRESQADQREHHGSVAGPWHFHGLDSQEDGQRAANERHESKSGVAPLALVPLRRHKQHAADEKDGGRDFVPPPGIDR